MVPYSFRFPSLSGLDPAAACSGSMVLPSVDNVGGRAKNTVGNARHEWNDIKTKKDREAAIEAIPCLIEKWGLDEKEADAFDAWARRIRPEIPEGAISEQPLCLLEDGSVVPVIGGQGRYILPETAIVAGTVDLAWTEPLSLSGSVCSKCHGAAKVFDGKQVVTCPECGGMKCFAPRCPPESDAWSVDIKTGTRDRVRPIHRNLQILGEALLVSKWIGATYVVPAVWYPTRGGGKWEVLEDDGGQPVALGPKDLAKIEASIRSVHARVKEEHERVRAGKAPRFTTGPHCEYCSRRTYCPAQTNELRMLLDPDAPLLNADRLSEEQRHQGVGLLMRLKRATEKVEAALKDSVEVDGDVFLDDGRQWGPHPVRGTAIIAEIAEPILAAEVGEEKAEAAMHPELRPKSAVIEAVEERHEELGIRRKVNATVDHLMGKFAKAGGLKRTTGVEWSAYRPEKGSTP